MRTNIATKRPPIYTGEGARAAHITPVQQLRRLVLSCMLWEDNFYSDGQSVADLIRDTAQQVPVSVLASLAVEARSHYNLRHVPLYLTALLAQHARGTSLVSETLAAVIQRADEIAEFLAIYAKVNGVTPDKLKPVLSNQIRKGLAAAFNKFNRYRLTRYANKPGAITMRDAMFLVHPRAADPDRKELFAQLAAGKVTAPETWEVMLSRGEDKAATFRHLIETGTLGYLALLRNLRGMLAAGVEREVIEAAILARKGGAERVLPFRYVAAARAAPQLEAALDTALMAAIDELPLLAGRTSVLVDVSSSMAERLSARSDLSRMDAACVLASMLRCENLRMFSFSDLLVEVPPRRGMAGVDALRNSQEHRGTHLFEAIGHAQNIPHDRMIVLTDEQASAGTQLYHYYRRGTMPAPACGKAYFINVAAERNGVGYGQWLHLDGFSEHVLRWIVEYESEMTD